MYKKVIIIALMFLIVFGGITLPAKKAQAVTVLGVSGIIDIDIDIAQLLLDIAKTVLKSILQTMKDRFFTAITNQIVAWISGEGEPRFVQDFGGFIKEIGNAAAGDVIIDLGYGNLCYQPLRFQLELQLQNTVFREQVRCTLTDVIDNISAFKDSFEEGGWIGYQETLLPANNPMGLTLLTQEEFLRRKDNEENKATYEATIGAGFLGAKKCAKWQARKDVTSPVAMSKGETISVGDANWTEAMYTRTPAGTNWTGLTNIGDESWQCISSQIVTPGKLAGDAIAKTLIDAPIERIISADELEEYISVIANAAINRLFKEGVDAIKGLAEMDPVESGSNCEDIDDESLRAACYKAQNQSGKVDDTRNRFWNDVRDSAPEQTEGYDDIYEPNTYDGGGTVPTTEEESVNEVIADLTRIRDDLEGVLLDEDESISSQLEEAFDDFTAAAEINDHVIALLDGSSGMVECWNNTIAQAIEAGEASSTIANYERNRDDLADFLSAAEADAILISNSLDEIDNYEERRDNLAEEIETAYEYDIAHVTETLNQGATFEIEKLHSQVYSFVNTISNITDTSSDTYNRVSQRSNDIGREDLQCGD